MAGTQEGSAATHQRAQQSLWAITSYFNPMGYQRRLANYRFFRKHLTVPLITVELSYGAQQEEDGFDLGEGEADILIQLSGGDVMWQKERLLNVALQNLPSECSKVVWLDCDVIFGREDWSEGVSRLLDDFVLVQPFSHVHHLPQDLGLGEIGPDAAEFSQPSGVSLVAAGMSACDYLKRNPDRKQGTGASGFAWAARRELLDEHGFYDACIMGGGDFAMNCALYGIFDVVMRVQCMNERRREHYLAWAEPFFESVGGAVSFADYELFHLWHGEMRNRQPRERHEGFRRYGFDPYEDIAIDENGCWRWASEKPQMHRYVKQYFSSRREDG